MVICPMSVPVCGARPVREAARVVRRMLLLLLCVRVMRGMMLRGMIGSSQRRTCRGWIRPPSTRASWAAGVRV